MQDSKWGSLSMQGHTLFKDNKQHDSSTNGSTFVSSKEMETEATEGAHATLPTIEVSSTNYILPQQSCKNSSDLLISLLSADSWPALFRNKYLWGHTVSQFPSSDSG